MTYQAHEWGAKYPNPALDWPIVTDGVHLIAEKECCALRSYPDPISRGDPWTNGWGETDGVVPGQVWSQEYADARLCADLTVRTAKVLAMCSRHPTQNELAALVSLSYNIGLRRDADLKRKVTAGGLYHSSVLRLHNEGKTNEAARAFLLLNRARDQNGQLVEVNGLTARRAAESALYLKLAEGEHWHMPQIVEAAPKLAASPTMQTGVVVVATGALAAAVPALEPDTLAQISELFTRFGIQPLWALAGLLIVAGAIILYRRVRQHNDGRA